MTRKSLIVFIFLFVFSVASLAAAGFFYRELGILKENPQRIAQEETKSLVANIGRLIDLPQGEDPTVATVSDPERLKDQPFFSRATKGDKVLIYTNARKAILYNPGRNKIVDVAPVNIGSGNTTTQSTGSASDGFNDVESQFSEDNQDMPSDSTGSPSDEF